MSKKELPVNILKQIHLSTTIDELLDMGVISKRTYNGCKNNGYLTIGKLKNLTNGEILKWNNCGKKVLTELSELQSALSLVTSSWEKIEGNDIDEPYLNQLFQIDHAFLRFSVLSETLALLNCQKDNGCKDRIQDGKIHKIASQLPFTCDETGERLINSISEIRRVINDSTFNAFIKNNQYRIEVLTSSINNCISRMNDVLIESGLKEDILSLHELVHDSIFIRSKFPFLNEDEMNFCIEFKHTHHTLPYWFILYKFLMRSQERQAQMICYRYGLYMGGQCKSLDEIAIMFQLTRERVRQLTDGDGIAIKNISPKELVIPKDIEWIQFLSEDDTLIESLLKENNLAITRKQLITLIDIASKPLGSTTFVKGGHSYLFSWDLWNDIDFQKLENFIKEVVNRKRTKNLRLTINDIIVQSGAFRNIERYSYGTLSQLIKSYLLDVKGIEPFDNDSFLWEQTHVTTEDILEIVSDKDTIITRDEIITECENRFPGLKCSSMDISQNPYLAAVGLKGFVPKSERHKYFSSIGDCAEAILNELGYPLSSLDLLNEIRERGCETSEASLRSLLSRKDENRFVRFVGDLWGLRMVDYEDAEHRNVLIIKKRTFEERLEELRSFVSAQSRMPICSATDEEASMVRWIRNVLNGLIEASSTQVQRLKDFLTSNSDLPQNKSEQRFIYNCQEYKHVVEFLRRRPSISSRPRLCAWFSASLKKDNLSPNNKRHFDELLSWLEEQGVFYG